MPGKTIIATKNLNVIYDQGTPAEYHALKDINIEIYQGEYVIFFGPSGSGKSTLLYALAGLERRVIGQIIVDGDEISSMSDHELERFHREKVGMVFQAYYLIPSVTIVDNVALPQIFGGASLQERRERAFKLLERFSVGQLADRFPTSLSGGQQQRVAIARALVNKPHILLADEPVGNLDSKSRINVMEVFTQLNKEDNQTIVLVTHEPDHLQFADRIFYLKDGAITRIVEHKRRIIPKRGPGMASELQSLLGRMPNLPEDQLKARLLMDYLLTTLRESELARIEEVLLKRIKNEITEPELVKTFDDSFREGGVGLHFATARSFSSKVTEVLHEAQILSKPYSQELKARFIIHTLREQLPQYSFQLNEDQTESLIALLIARMEKKITADALFLAMQEPVAKAGVGLSGPRARSYSHLIEVLIAEKPAAPKVEDVKAVFSPQTTTQLLLPSPHREHRLSHAEIAGVSPLLLHYFASELSEPQLLHVTKLIKLYLEGDVDEIATQRAIVEEVHTDPARITQFFNQMKEVLYLQFLAQMSNVLTTYFEKAGSAVEQVVMNTIKQWLGGTLSEQATQQRLTEQSQEDHWPVTSDEIRKFIEHMARVRTSARAVL
ncbi:MAG: ABC transporter, ATP-binding protein [Parcubacteria group bacterium GW2011_GWA2_47_8]|nr:MAG: ABC transporter, ATP-binding protein [Parcubacteria group bacterium GW2011_GWA2_47_8]OHB20105.1 MAG: hypothetical protein A2666_00020 [Parcubacteria group bacterium RIFCSPHIGHO2_01_FULL_47_10b]